MGQLSTASRRGRLLAGLALSVVAVIAGGGAGCSLMLETDNPQRCVSDADCARFPNAACDSSRMVCVPRLPVGGGDSGTRIDTGAGGTSGGLTCELSFDNKLRITLTGPDGGLLPLPVEP